MGRGTSPPDLPVELGEVALDGPHLEPSQDLAGRLPGQQELEGAPDQLLGPLAGASPPLQVARLDLDDVAARALALTDLDGALPAGARGRRVDRQHRGHGRRSATSWAVSGASRMPLAPWPVATTRLGRPGAASTMGRPSEVIGRSAAQTRSTAAERSAGTARVANPRRPAIPSAVGRSSKPTSSLVLPATIVPSGLGTR